MEPLDLTKLSAKELKVIAKEKGLEFAANASAKDMIEILEASEYDSSLSPTDDDEDTSGSGDEPKPNDWIDGKPPKGQYNVLTNILRNGKMYEAGDKIYFDEVTPEVEGLLRDKIIF